MRMRHRPNHKTPLQEVEEEIILHLLLSPYYELMWNVAENLYFYHDEAFRRAHSVSPYYDNQPVEQWAKAEGTKTHFDKLNEFIDSNYLDVSFIEHKDPDRRARWKRLYEIRRTPKLD